MDSYTVTSQPKTDTITPDDQTLVAAAADFDSMVSGEGTGSALAVPEEDSASPMQTMWTQDTDFEDSDLSYPRLRLAQGLTDEVQQGLAKPGNYVLTGFDPVESVTLIPIMRGMSRFRRNPEDRNDILCTSSDAKTGVGEPGGDCRTCQFAKWSAPTQPGKKGTPPQCTLSREYACWSIEHRTFVTVSFNRTSEAIGQTLNTFLKTRGFGNFGFRLGSKASNQPGRAFHTPTFVLAKDVAEGELDMARSGIPGGVSEDD